MITQSLFLLRSSTPLRVATSSLWRKDAVLAGGAGPGGIVATHRSQAECPEAVMLQATTVARPALGVARGVTAATRRSTEGIRTDRGIRPHGHEDRPCLGGWARACAVCAAIEYVMAFEDAQENLLASPLLSP